MSYQASNSTCALLLGRPGMVQNHLLLLIVYQMIYCCQVVPTDHAHASLWNEILFLTGGFGNLTEHHDEQKLSQNNKLSHNLLPSCQTHKVLSKWWYQPIFHTFPPQAPTILQLQTSVVTHGRISFSSIYVNKYLLVPLFTESALEAWQLVRAVFEHMLWILFCRICPAVDENK